VVDQVGLIQNQFVEKRKKESVEFGQLIRRIRQKRGLSQEKLAEMADTHPNYIGGIERGERNPTLLVICRLANALGVSPSHLLRK